MTLQSVGNGPDIRKSHAPTLVVRRKDKAEGTRIIYNTSRNGIKILVLEERKNL